MYETFVNLGFDNYIKMDRIIGILPIPTKWNKRLYADMKKADKIYDFTKGRKHKSLVLLDTGEGCVSAFAPRIILNGIQQKLEHLEGELELIEYIIRIGENVGR